MRYALLAALIAGCAPAPCPPMACAEACAALNVQIDPTVEPPSMSPVLTAWETEQLSEVLQSLRDGLQIREQSTGLCRGDAACNAMVDEAEAHRLSAGMYHLEVRYKQPALAREDDWRADLYQTCLVETGEGHDMFVKTETAHHPLTLEPTPDGWAVLRGPTFTSPRVGGAQACNWRFTFIGPAGATQRIEGTYAIPDVGVAADAPPPVPDEAATP